MALICTERTAALDLLRSLREMLGTSLFMWPSTRPASYQPVTMSCASRTVVGSTPRLQDAAARDRTRKAAIRRIMCLSYDTKPGGRFPRETFRTRAPGPACAPLRDRSDRRDTPPGPIP